MVTTRFVAALRRITAASSIYSLAIFFVCVCVCVEYWFLLDSCNRRVAAYHVA